MKMVLGSLRAILGAIYSKIRLIPADPEIINITGTYIPTLSITGQYQTSITITGGID